MSVSDDGQGVPSSQVEGVFFGEGPRVHALVLLRRRLQGLFKRSFKLEVRSELGEGTTVTMRIPLRMPFEVGLESPRAVSSALRKLAPYRGIPERERLKIQPRSKARKPVQLAKLIPAHDSRSTQAGKCHRSDRNVAKTTGLAAIAEFG